MFVTVYQQYLSLTVKKNDESNNLEDYKVHVRTGSYQVKHRQIIFRCSKGYIWTKINSLIHFWLYIKKHARYRWWIFCLC